MNKRYCLLICWSILAFGNFAFPQTNDHYSFIVAGHGYGAHAGTNIGLHPPFLEKLPAAITSETFALFLTGDLVNNSNTASWSQVEADIGNIGIPSYYCMGNHDSNSEGYAAFNKKHGDTFYSFKHLDDCFIVLNSTKTERSISSDQIEFLRTTLQSNISSKRVFIFFHEILWNSDVKYKDLMSNSRSRYSQIAGYSNFWTDVYTIIEEYRERRFYLFAGDVGGNTDAISAFYDVRGNLTLLASGMGEVTDENYLKVDVLADTVMFTFVPLRSEIAMHEAPFYNLPENPGLIDGPSRITAGERNIDYRVEPVFNATSYSWIVPEGIAGQSETSSISVDFSDKFISDTLTVYAVHEGYGVSPPSKLAIHSQLSDGSLKNGSSFNVDVFKKNSALTMCIQSNQQKQFSYAVFDICGRCLRNSQLMVASGQSEIKIDGLDNWKSPILLWVSDGKEIMVKKIQF